MYFIDFIPGAKDYFFLLDSSTKTYKKLSLKEHLLSLYTLKDLYCFDIYKTEEFFGQAFPLVNDLQLLLGLQQQKCDSIDELFDKDKSKSYLQYQERILAHLKSYKTCKIKFDQFALDKLISTELYDNFYKERANIIFDVLAYTNINPVTLNYYNTEEVISGLLTLLSISHNVLEYGTQKYTLKYTIFGAKNSRLTIRNKDFNLYNLPKEKRALIRCEPDFVFAQFDYKSFQPRVALSLFGSKEIKDKIKNTKDIYSLFPGERDKIKNELISWMFSDKSNELFDKQLSELRQSRSQLIEEQRKNGCVLNRFGRPLFFSKDEAPNVIFQNYISSTEADCILRVLSECHNRLAHGLSKIIAPFYDCIIFKIHKDEEHKISELKNVMEEYLYRYFESSFPVSCQIGKDLSQLKDYSTNAFVEAFSTKTP